MFRWYLGQSSRWANAGVPDRKIDYQVWCGPAMGAFNEWAKGSFLEQPANRRVVTVALNLLYGAALTTRLGQLRAQGVGLPAEWAALRGLAVDPEARGRGIGWQLAEACVLRAWRMGRQFLALHSSEFHEVARKLYLAMGFQRCPQYDLDVGDLPNGDLKGERLAIDAFDLNLKR